MAYEFSDINSDYSNLSRETSSYESRLAGTVDKCLNAFIQLSDDLAGVHGKYSDLIDRVNFHANANPTNVAYQNKKHSMNLLLDQINAMKAESASYKAAIEAV